MSLQDLLKPVQRSSSSKLSAVVSNLSVHNPSGITVNEVRKVGKTVVLEKPRLAVEVKENTEVAVIGKDYNLLITAILTKYPHYKFRYKIKSGETKIVRYWFLDTKRNVTVVMKYSDMQQELTCAMLGKIRYYEQGVENPEKYEPPTNSQDYAK